MTQLCIYHGNCADGLDVPLIAQQYGGGGHKHAAGFRVPQGHPLASA